MTAARLQPEEAIRQALISHMVDNLAYPESLISVEVSLHQLPHVRGDKLPRRRADLIVFSRGIHPDWDLYPLLMIECKAVPLNDKVLRQVTGYNHYVQAYFLAVVNGEECRTGWWDEEAGEYQFQDGLPGYEELVGAVTKPV